MFTGPAEMLLWKREFQWLEVTIGNESGNLKVHLLKFQPSQYSNNLSILPNIFCVFY
jgi:hypothetical protein